MREGIITTQVVRPTADGLALEVIATLDAGEVVPGMFVHIPMNVLLNLTVEVASVVREEQRRVRLTLDCGDDSTGVAIVAAFNFEDETLWVLETGES